MTTIGEMLAGAGDFDMPYLQDLILKRPILVEDPDNPAAMVESGRFTSRPIKGYIDTSASSETAEDSGRENASTSAVLVIPDPNADVLRHDVIEDAGRSWRVEGFPQNDVNPFVGWQPTLVANLVEEIG